MPIDQKIIEDIRSQLGAQPTIGGPAVMPSVSPDAVGAGIQVSRKHGGDPLTMAENPEQIRQYQLLDEWDRLHSTAPKTAGFLQNPVAAAIAQDDTENLSLMERALRGLGEGVDNYVVRPAKGAYGGIGASGYGMLQWMGEAADQAIGSTQRAAAGAFSSMFLPEARQGQGKPTMESLAGNLSADNHSGVTGYLGYRSEQADLWLKENGIAGGSYSNPVTAGVASGLQSTVQNLITLPASVLLSGGAPTLLSGAKAMSPIMAMTFGQEYGSARRDGLSFGRATAYSGVQAGIEGATELLPFTKLMGDIKASSPLWKTMIGQIVPDAIGEQAATVLQDLNEWANLHPEKTFQDYLDERPNAALQTAVASIVGSAVMTGPGAIMARSAYKRKLDGQRAEVSAKVLEQINRGAAASKVLARDADTFQDFVRQATEGGPVTDVYIDAQVLNQSGVAEQVLAASPAAAEQYQEALATGGQVRIPIDEYAARIAPQEYAQQLLDDLRLQPEDMTRREAQAYAQSGAMQELEAAISSLVGDKAQNDSFSASRDRVRQAVLDNLNALGRFTPQKNELDATLIAARSATRAAQLGITPEEFFNRHVLNVVAQGQAGEKALNQFAGQNAQTANLDALKVAQDRVAAGEDAETVRRETGWHTGTDGKWRFEISDADAKLTPTIKSLASGGYEARDIASVTYRKNEDGTYSLDLNPPNPKSTGEFVRLDSVPADVVRSVLPDDVFASMQRNEGEADYIGANMDDAKLIKSPFKFDGMNALPLDMVIDHPALFAAYPALRQVMVKVDPNAGIGGSLAETEDGTFVITVGAGQKQSTMLHEIQHAIQKQEGFAMGGSIQDMGRRVTEARWKVDDLSRRLQQIENAAGDEADLWMAKYPNKVREALDYLRERGLFDEGDDVRDAVKYAIYDRDPSYQSMTREWRQAKEAAQQSPTDSYRRLAGEVEARNTQARMNMTAAERQATGPQATADVAAADQIVRYAEGLALMVSDQPTEAEIAEAKRQLDEQLAIADRMIAERGGLFAPNGENSKLNRYQWAQVRTENFKRWFGDWENDPANASKVVDANGEPLVVYHGTGGYFDAFDRSKGGESSGNSAGRKGFFFADSAEIASEYAQQAKGHANVMPVFLSLPIPTIKKFRDIDQLDYWVSVNGFTGGLIGNTGDGQRVYMVKDANQIKSATGNVGTFGKTDNILYQPDGGPGPVKRGWYSPATNTIALLKNADLSTFLHESGHYFLETDVSVARDLLHDNAAFGPDTMTAGQQQILSDVSALLKWFGIEGDIASQVDQWDRMDFEEKRNYHEQLAESFERYLMEGKAPSIELQTAFQSFRQWLINVYKSVRDFLTRHPDAGELNDEVRAVFDRMLATDEEIKLAKQARSMIPLFADAVNAGMTPAEFADYQRLGEEATRAAIDKLQAQGMRDMKWLGNARSRMLKKLQKQAKAQRSEMRAVARFEVLQEPVYQAWNVLTGKMTEEDSLAAGKKKRSDSVDPAVDSLFEAIAKLGGLNKEALVAQFGIDPKDKAESGIFGKPVMRAKDGGRSLDWMVEALTEEGYLTPDENGKGDILELEEKFKEELRGNVQYSRIKDYEPDQLPGAGQDLGGITAARIDRGSLDAMEDVQQEVIDRLVELKMTAKTGGIHPDVLSEVLPGWTSGDELVRALASARPLNEEIETRTDQLMMEQYADLATPEAIERAADMAIHNDARERFLAAEHSALVKSSGDKSQKQMLLSAARDFARRTIGRQRIRDIRPSQYAAAETRAAKAAATAKDITQKIAEKRNQTLSAMLARESYAAKDDVDKALRYLKKFDSPTIRKRVNGDYVDQIEAMLEKVDLRKRSLKDIDRKKSFGAFVRSQIEKGVVPAMSDQLLPPNLRAAYQSKVMERDESGELILKDDVDQASLLADYLDMAESRSYKDMTLDEFRGLVETIRQIEHLGRKKKSLLTARNGETYEQKRDELAESVRANSSRLPDRLNRTIPNDRAEKLRGMLDFRMSLRKIGMIMRLLDGNKDGGPMWDFFVRSANERGDWETEEISKASEVLTNALRPVFSLKGGMRGKGVFFDSIGRSLNREQRIGLALNVGNEGNLQRLLDGEGWTYADIQLVLESLTTAEWQAVQQVWDHMGSYRPMIAAIEKRTNGAEPEWVQPMQFTVRTKDGETLTLPGGYYPVKYDIEASQRAEELSNAEDAKRAMNAATNSSTTHRSFVKKRSEAVVGRPIELSLSAMYSGVQDVIHDLAWREWLIDASKMISSSTLDDAIRTKHGAETVRAIRQWISDIAAGTKKPRGVFDRAASFLRKNVAASGLALNVMNAVQNVTGLVNSADRIGAKWLAIGQAEYAGGPAHMKEVGAWVDEKSSFMANRAKTQFRDLNELRNIVENGDGIITKAKQNQFILMTITQRLVDVPTWIGAYRKAEAEGAVVIGEDGSIDDSKAVAMADQAVIDAQGSGMIKDLSAVERGGELAKLFTAYYSYMNTTYNLVANRVAGARGGGAKERGSAAFHTLVIMALPVALMAVLKAALTPGDDEDWQSPEKLAKKLAMEQASFAMGLIPIAREFTPAIQPLLQDQTFGYQGPSGMRLVGDAVKFSQQASQGEFDDGFRKAAIGLSGSIFGLPSAQIGRTWTGAEAMANDKTDNPAALLFGYQGK